MDAPQPIAVSDPQSHSYDVPATGLQFQVKTKRFRIRALQGATVVIDGVTSVLPASPDVVTMQSNSGLVAVAPPTGFPVELGPVADSAV